MNPRYLYLDTETFSEIDLTECGTYRYAENAEVMLMTWAFDDGPVQLWDHNDGTPPPALAEYVASNPDVVVVAHNAMFDRNVLKRGNLKLNIPIERWQCTAVQAMQHALPAGLSPLGKLLGLASDTAKDKAGNALIKRFCMRSTRRYNPLLEALKAVPLATAADIGAHVYVGANVRKVGGGNRGTLDGLDGSLALPYSVRGKRVKYARRADLVDAARATHPDEMVTERVRYDAATHPEEWAAFRAYAAQDIEALRAVHKLLPTVNWQPDDVADWHLDQRINDRGFRVDMGLAEAGMHAAAIEKQAIAKRFSEITGGPVPTQRAKVQAYINARWGLSLTSTAKDVIHPLLGDASQPVELRELVGLMLAANKTSTSKYGKILYAACADGWFRGGLQFSGAMRTRRWAGRIFQPQNLPSRGLPEEALIDAYIEALKAGCHVAMFKDLMLYGAAALRGLVIAGGGKTLHIADLSNIEGRILAWIAGEQWKLDAFVEYDEGRGPDLYNITATGILGGDPYEVSKANRNAFGKVPDLALGFEGGVAALQTFAAAYGIKMADHWATIQQNVSAELVDRAHGNLRFAGVRLLRDAYPGVERGHQWPEPQITWAVSEVLRSAEIDETEWLASEAVKLAWRDRHPATQQLWRACKDAATDAIRNPGEVFRAGPLLSFEVRTMPSGNWLLCRLPSGKYLTYYDPQLSGGGGIAYQGYGQTDSTTRVWGTQYTYGGKFVENACQAIAGDILKATLPGIEQAGYEIVLTVHDEAVTQAPAGPAHNADDLSRLLSIRPAWAGGLPLSAAGFSADRYRK